jgi:hypothetical protein
MRASGPRQVADDVADGLADDAAAHQLAGTMYQADALIWSSPRTTGR